MPKEPMEPAMAAPAVAMPLEEGGTPEALGWPEGAGVTEGAGAEEGGSTGAEAEGWGAEGTGSEGAGTDGAGSEGAGTEGAGTEGAGTEGAGTEGAGSEGLGGLARTRSQNLLVAGTTSPARWWKGSPHVSQTCSSSCLKRLRGPVEGENGGFKRDLPMATGAVQALTTQMVAALTSSALFSQMQV